MWSQPTETQETSPPSLAPVVTIITPAPSPAPSTCEERKVRATVLYFSQAETSEANAFLFFCFQQWYAVSTNTEELCSNGYDIPAGWGGSEIYYDSLEECCQEEFSSNTCPFKDVCNTPIPTQAPQSPAPSPKPSPFPSVPIITPNPTEEKILTPQPSSPSPTTEAPVSPAPTISTPFPVVTIITPIPTEAPVTPRPSFFPTSSPSFGSTPTVSDLVCWVHCIHSIGSIWHLTSLPPCVVCTRSQRKLRGLQQWWEDELAAFQEVETNTRNIPTRNVMKFGEESPRCVSTSVRRSRPYTMETFWLTREPRQVKLSANFSSLAKEVFWWRYAEKVHPVVVDVSSYRHNVTSQQ